MHARGSLWLWAGIFLVIGVADVAVLTATGNGDSGQNDGPGQVFGFFLFLLCVLLVVCAHRHRRCTPLASAACLMNCSRRGCGSRSAS